MRFKYYLRGIGLGILFAVVIMAVAIHFHKDELVSDDDVIKRAAKLGMVMDESENTEIENATNTEAENSADSEVDSERPLDDFVSGTEETSTELIPASEGITEETEGINNTDGGDSTDASQVLSMDDFADKDYVIVSIEAGDVPRDLCDKLQAYNIIEDSDDFRHYIGKKKGIVLMVGEYKIPKDATYDDIIKIIFKK